MSIFFIDHLLSKVFRGAKTRLGGCADSGRRPEAAVPLLSVSLMGSGQGFLMQDSLFRMWQYFGVPYVEFLAAADGRICPNKEPIM